MMSESEAERLLTQISGWLDARNDGKDSQWRIASGPTTMRLHGFIHLMLVADGQTSHHRIDPWLADDGPCLAGLLDAFEAERRWLSNAVSNELDES